MAKTAIDGRVPFAIWMTGLSGAGKTTLARTLKERLIAINHCVYVLDGDVLRRGLCSDLGFSDRDRAENLRRAAEVAAILIDAGISVIGAFICPRRGERQLVRGRLGAARFVEVFVNAPLSVCEQRDTKGLYARARRGELLAFTGISAPYEPPDDADIEVQTDLLSVEECCTRILNRLVAISAEAPST
jgi:bifunctional enzyme CysN/CysC